jgi:hypothetical protein
MKPLPPKTTDALISATHEAACKKVRVVRPD